MAAPTPAKKAGYKTLRVTKTSFSLGALLNKLHIPEHSKESFRDTVQAIPQPEPIKPTASNDLDTSTEESGEKPVVKKPFERINFDRALPDLDSVSQLIETSFSNSSIPLRVHSDQLDEKALFLTLIAVFSPTNKLDLETRETVASALCEKVFPSIPIEKAKIIHVRALALSSPPSYLFLLHEQRSFHSSTFPYCPSDYCPQTRWTDPKAFEYWRSDDLKRIEALDHTIGGDSSQESFPPPVLMFQLFQARHLSKEKSSHPKSISVSMAIEFKSSKGEKRRSQSVTCSDFGTDSTLDSQPIFLPCTHDHSKKAKQATSEDQLLDHWKSQNATVVIKLRNENVASKINSGTMAKIRLPLVDLFKMRRGNTEDAWSTHWLQLGGSGSPELSLKSVLILPSDHLRLESSPLTLGATYSRASNRLFLTEGVSKVSQHTHSILEAFGTLFGIAPLRSQLTSLESHLLFGDTSIALDRMMRLVQHLDEVQRKANPKEMMTISEAALYTHLRPAVYRFSSMLVENCTEAFPDNFPSGGLRRALSLSKHFSNQGESFAESLTLNLRISAKIGFYSVLYPGRAFDEAFIRTGLASGVVRDKKLPDVLHSFTTIHSAINYVKQRVIQHECHFGGDFTTEAGIDSAAIFVGVYAELLSQALESYFREGHRELRRERKGSIGNGQKTDEVDAEVMEHRLVFQSVDSLRFIITHWQKHTKSDLHALLPIYDYLEHGMHWWLESLTTQMQRWSADVLHVDDFEPMDESGSLLHSSSVIHLFSISHEALGVITPVLAFWAKPTAFDHLAYFINSFCKSTEMYCANVEVIFTQHTSVAKDKSRIPQTLEEKRISVETSKGKKHQTTAPVAIKSLFAPIARSSKFAAMASKLQDILRTSEDPSQLLPADQRFKVTQTLCVHINNVETVRNLINERADMLFDLYESIYEGPTRPLVPGDSDYRPTKEEKEEWISNRFQKTLLSIKSISEGMLNEVCSALTPFVEGMLFFILRMYRGDKDGKVRNEGNRLMSKLTSKASVSQDEVSQELEPVFEFLDDAFAILSKSLYYAVFKRLIKMLWAALSRSLEDVLLPHAEKHFMKSDQIAKFLCIEVALKDYFTYDGESLPESIALDTIHTHQLVAASLTKSTKEVTEILDGIWNQSSKEYKLLSRLMILRSDNKDHDAKHWLRKQELNLKSR